MTGKEMLTSMGMCVSAFAAQAAHVDVKDVSMLSQSQQVKCAGNGMHLACVGLSMLAAVLLTRPKA
jgi:hypothetical protein